MAAAAKGGGSTQDDDAKHMFDRIGQQVYKEKVENDADAEKYKQALKGDLNKASGSVGELAAFSDPCNLKSKYTELISGSGGAARGERYPCTNLSGKVERFSNTLGGQCTDSKMRSDGKGACAPFRRLHLCDYNLEKMGTTKIDNTHKLLLEVCMAAYYEGDLIKTRHRGHQLTNVGTSSQLCTVLARSFADIGDIVRGRDLFYGNDEEKKQRDKLDENLKNIFAKIHSEVTTNGKNGAKELQKRYDGDGDNYYKLREDWWTANRHTVWKAITCDAPHDAQYFRPTCNDDETLSYAIHQCRCKDKKTGSNADQVPTYFDYVPQYLRWFEEWAEDFCRKKNKKIKDVKRNCRGPSGTDKYCSRNGYDCEKTKRAIGKLRYGNQCISCLYGCNPYVEWIEKQKEQFDKQVKKYTEEINGTSRSRRQKRDATATNYEGYESKFYNKLKEENYGKVDDFLELLSKENVCTQITDEKEGKINFEKVNSGGTAGSGGTSDTSGTNDETKGTFYRSKYCQPCPVCGVKKKSDGGSGYKWEEKHNSKECKNINLYRPNDGATPTEIKILKSGDEEKEIAEKLKKFCETENGSDGNGVAGGRNSDSSLCEPWQCYEFKQLTKVPNPNGVDDDDDHDYVKTGGGLCILENQKKKEKSDPKSQNEPEQFQKTFHDFFYYWVAHMLKDSIHWRTKKINKCLKNGNRIKCTDKCKGDCDCFKRWVKQKKEQEWTKIKDHFKTQNIRGTGGNDITVELIPFDHDLVLEGVLQKKELLESLQEGYGNAEDIKHIKELLEEDETKSKAEEAEAGETDSKKKNTIDWLIQHEEDDAELCLEIHDEEEEEKEKGDGNECIEEGENFRYNPCSGESGGSGSSSVLRRYPALANKVAYQMHEKARQQLTSRAGGRSALRADATKGQYNGNGNVKNLNGKICNINGQYSNAESNKSNNPCNGKGDRFKIEEVWKNARENGKVIGVYLPPRRQHICTSNVEHLLPPKGGRFEQVPNGKASHSLLGDVLIAAKKEAEFIKSKVTNNDNGSAICRAIKYSFADIGDIIRGKDLWDDKDQVTLQDHLKTIFGKIKGELKGEDKYKGDDENKTPPYKLLRSDWWEANRHQVWRAMKCALKSDKIQCRMTPDDYIPQRLRWMTEWAEWYCKYQSQEYETLQKQCGRCTGKLQGCTSGDSEVCKQCKEACAKYTENIKEWADQWKHIKIKYEELYLHAKNDSPLMAFDGTDPDYKQVVHFFEVLQKEYENATRSSSTTKVSSTATTPITPYSTAAGYIHQEIGYGGCQEQTQFCENKNGVTRNTDGDKENKDKYAFRKKPYDHDEACDCGSKTPKGTVLREPCTIVHEILNGKSAADDIEGCKKKEDRTNPYPPWECDTKSGLVMENGICMPPRRQKLCLYFVADTNEKDKIKTQDDLRDGFIRTAAAETFVSWKYYKSKNNNGENTLDEQLKKGYIPEEFLRSMFYTYGDYRDILFNTDISAKTPNGHVKKATDFILKFFPSTKGNSPHKLSRENWWNEYAPSIWRGMLCGLSHASGSKDTLRTQLHSTYINHTIINDLQDFAKTPQFLRWFIEWSDEFCKNQQKQYMDLVNRCTGCDFSNDGNCTQKSNCNDCSSQCTEYQKFITQWKGQWEKQRDKYQALYTKATTSDNTSDSDEAEKKLLKYLKELKDPSGSTEKYSTAGKYIKQEGYIDDCNVSGQNNFDENSSGGNSDNYAFKNPPQGYDMACKCMENVAKPNKEETTPPLDVCSIVGGILTKDNLQEACKTKYDGKYYGWRCVAPSGTTSGEAKGRHKREADSGVTATGGKDGATGKSDGSVCVPPRRRKLYVGELTKWANSDKTEAKSQEISGSEAPSQSGEKLRDAFIESAAVETFFLWDRYKKEWTAQKLAELQRQNGLLLFTQSTSGGPQALPKVVSDDPDNPQNQLQKSGKIPPDFLRLMFYTLGDYRDILYSGSNDSKNGYNDIINGDKVIQEREENIKEKIKSFFSNSGEQPPPDKDPQSWWKTNGQHIWNGMICALTYKEASGSDGSGKTTTINQDSGLKEKLWDTTNKKPKGKYGDYKNVKLKDEPSDTKPTEDTLNNPKLSDFVKLPPFFRWLHEWGSDFCGTRKHLLEKIEGECKVEEGARGKEKTPKCSCYGEHCDDQLRNEPTTLHSLECPGCGRHCRSYKKWIERKGKEFEEQQKIYDEQKQKVEKNNGFCTKLKENYTNAAEFLHYLASCKKDNASGQGNRKDILDFSQPKETFKPATNCKPCSEFKIKCENCKSSGGTQNKCNGKKAITKDDIKDSTEDVIMRISDNSGNGFQNGLNECADAGIFEGFRKEQWKCGNFCGYVVCKPKNGNSQKVKEKQNDEKHIITIRGFVAHWVQNFLDDYNKIKHKISHCKENSEQTICKKDCKDKCKCVGQWIDNKKKEWEEIKKRYLEQYNDKDQPDYNVKTVLEEFKERPEFKNAIKPCTKFDDFEKSKECAVAANSQGSDANKKDVVICLLHRLQNLKDKIDKCKEKHPQTGDQNQTQTCQESPLEPDEEDLLLYETKNTGEEKKNMMPTFCDIEDEKPKENEGDCEPASPAEEKKDEKKEEESGAQPPTPSSGHSKNEQTPSLKPEEEAPAPADQPFDPTILQTTIPFGVALALGSIAFLFLKVINIYIYMCGIYVRSVWVCLDIYLCICMCFIYILYICIYIDKEKNEKNEKKKKEKDFKNNKN